MAIDTGAALRGGANDSSAPGNGADGDEPSDTKATSRSCTNCGRAKQIFQPEGVPAAGLRAWTRSYSG